jgi:hypothetical protein
LSRMDYTSDEEEWADFLGQLWLGSGKSRRISRTCITTHSSFPTGRLRCSLVSVRVSKRLCCNCRLLRARRRKRRSRSALLSSPNRIRRGGAWSEKSSDCGAEAQTSTRRWRSRQARAQAAGKRTRRSPQGSFPASDPVSMSSRHRPPPTATGQRPEGRCVESHRVARNGDAEGSPGAATGLRIGLEPTGSASGDAVSPTPVPTASA